MARATTGRGAERADVSDLPGLDLRRDASPRDSLLVTLLPAIVFAAIIGAWEAWVRIAEVKRYLLPAPTEIARALAAEPMRYVDAAATSLGAALGGLLEAGTKAEVDQLEKDGCDFFV